jgi:uncharacterized membrane protein YfcA
MLLTIVRILLILAIFVFAATFLADYLKAARARKLEKVKLGIVGPLGFVVNFFDTLGIGSFAPTTAAIKNFKLSDDRTIPGTLNVANAIPVFFQSMILLTAFKVEIVTLLTMIAAAVLGSILGAGVVARMDVKKVRIGMGLALFAVASVMLAGQVNLMPSGGDAFGLSGVKLGLAIAGSFVLGSLMTIGIGYYAPCMAIVYALGMSPRAAFPIMTAACAFLQPACSIKFIKEGAYNRKISLIVTLFGSVGVIIAGLIVKTLPLRELKWVVIVVVFYTSAVMFYSAFKKTKPGEEPPAACVTT